MALRDRRRLGRVRLDPDHTRLGPDAATVGREAFRRAIGRGDAPLKARIMDQGRISGVGNLLADEALWQARLAPLRPAGSLSDAELDALRRAIRAGIRRADRAGRRAHRGDHPAPPGRGGLPALRRRDGAGDRRRAHDLVVLRRAGLRAR